MLNEEFEFAVTDTATMEIVSYGKNNAEGEIIFEEINYTVEDIGKTYIYKVTEMDTGAYNVEYDDTAYTLTVTITQPKLYGPLTVAAVVTDNDGNSATLIFDNKYTVPAAEINLTGLKNYNHILKDKMFEFVVKDRNEKTVATGSNDEFGVITFTPLTYTSDDVGKHIYTVYEVKSNTNAFIYDDAVYTVTVTVSQNGQFGEITAVEAIKDSGGNDADIVFDNKYKPGRLESAEIICTKIIDGKYSGSGINFTFNLTQVKNASGEDYDGPGIPHTDTATVTGECTFNFELKDIGAGKYYYKIEEDRSSVPAGWIYSENVWIVAVTVTDRYDGTASVSMKSVSGSDVFTNIPSALRIKKTVELTGYSYPAGGTFVITDDDDNGNDSQNSEATSEPTTEEPTENASEESEDEPDEEPEDVNSDSMENIDGVPLGNLPEEFIFTLTCEGVPVDLSDYTVESDMRDITDALVDGGIYGQFTLIDREIITIYGLDPDKIYMICENDYTEHGYVTSWRYGADDDDEYIEFDSGDYSCVVSPAYDDTAYIEYKNSKEVPEPTISAEIILTKTVSGILITEQEFTFVLTELNSPNESDEKSLDGDGYTDTQTITGAGSVKFVVPELKAGIYYYKIYETGSAENWVYDTDSRIVTVKVEIINYKLIVSMFTVNSGEFEFKNTYIPPTEPETTTVSESTTEATDVSPKNKIMTVSEPETTTESATEPTIEETTEGETEPTTNVPTTRESSSTTISETETTTESATEPIIEETTEETIEGETEPTTSESSSTTEPETETTTESASEFTIEETTESETEPTTIELIIETVTEPTVDTTIPDTEPLTETTEPPTDEYTDLSNDSLPEVGTIGKTTTETETEEDEGLDNDRIPLNNGWYALELGDGVYEIFDANGNPLGIIYLPDGMDIVDYDGVNLPIEPIVPIELIVPIEPIDNIIISETQRPNPRTGNSNFIGVFLICGAALIILKKKKI
jgi:pilin isopeptide linkage protein